MGKKVVKFLENLEVFEEFTCLEESDYCDEVQINFEDVFEEEGIEDSYVDFSDVKV